MEEFNILFNKTFTSSQEAISHCQELSQRCGFNVRIRTSKSSSIYIVCSREGNPELKPHHLRKRNRTSDRCNCKWKVVLFFNLTHSQWEFRSGKNMIHNHSTFNQLSSTKSPTPYSTYERSYNDKILFNYPQPLYSKDYKLPSLREALKTIMSDQLPSLHPPIWHNNHSLESLLN